MKELIDLFRKAKAEIFAGLVVQAVVTIVSLLGGMGTLTIGIVAISALWLISIFVVFRRVEIHHSRKMHAERFYSQRVRRVALMYLVLIPLITVGGVIYHAIVDAQTPSKLIVLVADFDGPEPQRYRVTETVLSRLRIALESYETVEIQALREVITESDGSVYARSKAENRKATILIWGWYGITSETVPLSVHFEVLSPPEGLPEFGGEAKGSVQTVTVSELESFSLQTRLSAEMAYLTLFTAGMVQYTAEDWDEAITQFGDALAQLDEPVSFLEEYVVYMYRGLAYYHKDDYAHATRDFEKVVELKPNFAQAYNNLGSALVNDREYREAATTFTHAIDLYPEFAEAFSGRADAYNRLGEYDLALADSNWAITLSPGFASAYNNRGAAYYLQGKYELALRDFSRAVELDPDSAVAYLNLGNAHVALDEYSNALDAYDQAIDLKSDFAGAFFERAKLRRKLRDYSAAIVDFNRANELGIGDSVFYNERGSAFYGKADYDGALADFDRAVLLNLGNAIAIYNRGNAYSGKKEYEQAIADYNQALLLKPDLYEAVLQRGKAYMALGNAFGASQDFQLVINAAEDSFLREEARWRLQVLKIPW